MTPRRNLIALTTAAALLASGGVAAAADAPVVSAQHTSSATTAPVTVPGTGLKKGERLPKGARIVYRDVTLEKGQKTTTTLTAPSGKTLRGLAVRDNDKVGFAVSGDAKYTGKRTVKVRAFTAPKATGEVTGRIYALVR